MIRVLPRDAFNDANLLKCIGKLTLMIEDKILNLKYEYDGKPFDIHQNESDGSTYVENINFYTPSGFPLIHYRPLNARDDWPLMFQLKDDDYYVFYEDGRFMPTQLQKR